MLKRILLICLLINISLDIVAKEPDFSGNIGIEFRGFTQTPRFNNQGQDIESSLFVQPEIKWRSDDKSKRFSFVGFARADEQDSERSHIDIRELYWSFRHNNWTTEIGINKVFWGVTESVHLIDVINQTDLVEDIDQEDKLGQAMIHVSNQQNWGRLEFFILPYFRERTFTGTNGRFNFGLKVSDDVIYESAAEQKHIDLAFRYSHYFGDVDVGLSLFDGTSREARLILNNDFSQLIAVYDQMQQLGIDIQYTRESWLWKLESLYRNTGFDNFWAAVGGFEYTLYQIFDSSADLGLLLEFQYDGRNNISPASIADNDLFLAARYALNDINDSSVLAGVGIDIENNTTFLNIEAERRFGKSLSAELRIRVFTNVASNDLTLLFSNDDYVQLSLNWFF
jgi:hypothetical protein